jgi:pyrimidine operon attenuation protein/uracil phosphoribosyltransferase
VKNANVIDKYRLMDEKMFFRTIRRIALEIIENLDDEEDFILAGIRTRGIYLAEYIKFEIKKEINKEVPIGEIDISFYRDDLTLINDVPIVKGTRLDVDIKQKTIYLIDDVLYTGRTVRAGMDAIFDFGRPKSIKLVIFIDRGWHELPIYPDIVGRRITTTKDEVVKVKVKEIDGCDEVWIAQKYDKTTKSV